jgi:hypothetical protein
MKLRPPRRAPRRALPLRLRRYGDELDDLLDHSDRRMLDWLDVLRLGLRARLEDNMRSIVAYALALTAAASLVAMGYATAELAGGVQDVHEHWWSAAPLVVFALSALGALLIRRPIATG